nr:immunoglobulin heavy chain junction region [Mus musculus]MBK4189308.1 immunoglobulin heavy chain junction region [Mus musculus]
CARQGGAYYGDYGYFDVW